MLTKEQLTEYLNENSTKIVELFIYMFKIFHDKKFLNDKGEEFFVRVKKKENIEIRRFISEFRCGIVYVKDRTNISENILQISLKVISGKNLLNDKGEEFFVQVEKRNPDKEVKEIIDDITDVIKSGNIYQILSRDVYEENPYEENKEKDFLRRRILSKMED